MWGNKMALPVSSLTSPAVESKALLSAEISCTCLGSQQGPVPQLTSYADASCSMCDPFFFLTPCYLTCYPTYYLTCFCMLSNHTPQGRMRP